MNTSKLSKRVKDAMKKLPDFSSLLRCCDAGDFVEFVIDRFGDICVYRVYNNGDICEK